MADCHLRDLPCSSTPTKSALGQSHLPSKVAEAALFIYLAISDTAFMRLPVSMPRMLYSSLSKLPLLRVVYILDFVWRWENSLPPGSGAHFVSWTQSNTVVEHLKLFHKAFSVFSSPFSSCKQLFNDFPKQKRILLTSRQTNASNIKQTICVA